MTNTTPQANEPRIREVIDLLGQRDTKERINLFMTEVLETGGTWADPEDQPDGWASHLVELSLYGIPCVGRTLEEAIRNWILVAKRMVDGDYPFMTPRNDAEEIANARAFAGLSA